MNHAARDLNLRVEEIKKKYPSLKCIIHGHSLGGLISTLMVKENPKCIDGLILEAPAFKIHEATAKWYIILGAKLLNSIAPKTKVGGVEFHNISRNIDVNKEKERLYPEYGDCGGMMAGTAVHMMAVQDKLMAQMNQIQVKTLICTGTDDKLTAFSGSEYAHSQFQNSEFKAYQGAYHALHDELPETTEAFMKDVQEFISALL